MLLSFQCSHMVIIIWGQVGRSESAQVQCLQQVQDQNWEFQKLYWWMDYWCQINYIAPAVFYHGKYNQHILAMSLLAKEHVAYHGLAT